MQEPHPPGPPPLQRPTPNGPFPSTHPARARDSFAKTTRAIACRDALWDALIEAATELDCTVDYLVNDALKLYVRTRLTRRPTTEVEPTPTPTGVERPGPIAPASLPSPPLPPPLTATRLPPPLPALPPLPPRTHSGGLPPPPPPLLRDTHRVPLPSPPAPARLRLAVTYGAETVLVASSGFVIGRRKSAGLSIKDPNVSRRHARIDIEGDSYVLIDEGSTNGILLNGERVTRRVLRDGDVALVGEHPIRFSFVRANC